MTLLNQNETLAGIYMKEYPVLKGNIIYNSVEVDTLFLKKGIAVVEVFNNERWEALTILKDKGILGLELFSEHTCYEKLGLEYRVVALTICRIVRINTNFLMDHMYVIPKFLFDYLEYNIAQYIMIIGNYRAVRNSLEQRLADLLLKWGRVLNTGAVQNEIVFPFCIKYKMLAEALKSSKPRVYAILNDWEANGIIMKRGTNMIASKLELEKLAYF